MMKKESHGLMKLCSLAGNWTCAHCERGPVKILFEGNISRQRKKKKTHQPANQDRLSRDLWCIACRLVTHFIQVQERKIL